jgi:Flp pilus assembly pilin Flp
MSHGLQSGRFQRFGRDQRGSAAVEFAMLVAPLLFLLLGIFEVGMQYFVLTAFDSAVQRTARLVRTGQAQSADMSLAQFRVELCSKVWDLFDCNANTYFTVEAMNVMEPTEYTTPVEPDGSFVETEIFDLGVGNSYVMIRGYLQFSPLFDVFGALTPALENGNHLFVASALFRNEPF